ncbi:MAG: cobalt-zinc-cadmium efflux system protein [Salibacteraceae bacterium]|jgi:cobalt-zinc-cadmium efflux system protein
MGENIDHKSRNHNSSNNIRVAFFLNVGFTIFEFIGGMYVNSVAIMSDALHDFGDSLSLELSWYIEGKSKKGADHKFTFGYQRFSLLGALVNSVILIIGSIFIIIEGIDRLRYPELSNAEGMLFIALIGVAVNGYAAYKLSSGKSMNEKVIRWHLIEDVLGWVAVVIVSVVLLFKNIPYLDPALSLLITLYILWNVGKRLRETLNLFLEGSPVDLDVEKLNSRIRSLDTVISFHDFHLWSLDGEQHVFSIHLVISKDNSIDDLIKLKKDIRLILKEFEVNRCTIEIDFDKGDLQGHDW